MGIKVFAESLVKHGLSILPCKPDKAPYGMLLPLSPETGKHSWSQFQKRLPTPEEIESWFPLTNAIAIIGGAVSGNLAQLDFEGKDHAGRPIEPIYTEFKTKVMEAVKAGGLALTEPLSTCRTPSGGYHVRWRVETDAMLACNPNLARRPALDADSNQLIDENGKPILDKLIETKNEGGYCLCPPSAGYTEVAGSLLSIPVLSLETHEVLMSIAASFDQPTQPKTPPAVPANPQSIKPGDDFNQRGDYTALLQKHGWSLHKGHTDKQEWTRPGKSGACSGVWAKQDVVGASGTLTAGHFYVWSSNASPLEAKQSYDKFSLYAHFEHDGDFSQAAKALASQGYGQTRQRVTTVGRSAGEPARHSPIARDAKAENPVVPEVVTLTVDEINQQIAQILMIDSESEKRAAVKAVLADAAHLDPIDQASVTEKLKAGGLGNKTLFDAQIKAAKRAERQPTSPIVDNGLPIIPTTDRHLRDTSDGALDAILATNANGERIFQRGGHLTRLKRFDETTIAEPLTLHSLRGELSRCANFLGGRTADGQPAFRPIVPPSEVVNDLLSLPDYSDFPTLNEVVYAPVFSAAGNRLDGEGYQSETKTYHVNSGMEIGDIDTSDESVDAAKDLIFDKLLGEFAFANEASKANALALMLLPFVRPMIDGPTPLHLIDAPVEGSGKGLLADVLTFPSNPHGSTLMTEGESDEEWRKRITAVLSEAPTHVLIDNVARKLDAPSFAAALTSKHWSDRLLGTNSTVKLPVGQTWVATGNNVQMSREITRRAVWVRLRPTSENPSEQHFEIKNLRKWAMEHRQSLVEACLTLIQRWVDDGMPVGSAIKGSYESWAEVLSGILESIGIDGFLQNHKDLATKSSDEVMLWHEFVSEWASRFGRDAVGVKDLFGLASTQSAIHPETGQEVTEGLDILSDLLPQKTARGRAVKLGALMKEQVDRVYGNLRIVQAEPYNGKARYALEDLNILTSQDGDVKEMLTRLYSSDDAGSSPPHNILTSQNDQSPKTGVKVFPNPQNSVLPESDSRDVNEPAKPNDSTPPPPLTSPLTSQTGDVTDSTKTENEHPNRVKVRI